MFTANHAIEYSSSYSTKALWNKAIGSGVYFAIAWVLMNYLTSGVSALFAWSLGYTPKFSLDGLSSLAGTEGWCGSYVAKVFVSAPVCAISISIAAWVLFTLTNRFKTHLRTFLFWLAMAGFIIYYGYVMAGLTYLATGIPRLFTGFVATYTWVRWETETIAVVLVVQAIVSLAMPLLFLPQISRLSPSRSMLQKHGGKAHFFLTVFVKPLMIGIVLVLVASFPLNLHFLVIQVFACSLVVIIGYAGLRIFYNPMFQTVRGGLTSRPVIYYLVLAIGLIAFARLVLSIPVSIVI